MNLIMKCARFLALLIAGLWLAGPALADDGDGASFCPEPFPVPCAVVHNPLAGWKSDYLRPGSVLVFPKFERGGGNIAGCGAGNVFVNGEGFARTERGWARGPGLDLRPEIRMKQLPRGSRAPSMSSCGLDFAGSAQGAKMP